MHGLNLASVPLVKIGGNGFREPSVKVRLLFPCLGFSVFLHTSWVAVGLGTVSLRRKVDVLTRSLRGRDAVGDLKVVVLDHECAPYEVIVGVDEDWAFAEKGDQFVDNVQNLLLVGSKLKLVHLRIDKIHLISLLFGQIQVYDVS